MDIRKSYLGNVCYEIGEQKKISNLPFFYNEPDLLDIFISRGLECYTESHLSPNGLLRLVLSKTIQQSDLDPKEVDTVVVATDSFWDESVYSRSALNQTMNALGLTNAYPIGISMMECTSSSIALQVGTNLIHLGKAENVLVVCTNKVKQGHDNERIIQPGISILSDAAVACLLTTNKRMPFEILSIDQTHSSMLEQLNPEENFEDFVEGSVQGFELVAHKIFNALELTVTDFQWLITNNYLPHIIMMFSEKIGFTKDQCFLDNIARFAHAHTADTLINLKDFSDNKKLQVKDRLLLLSNSPTSWGAVALQKI